MFLVHAIELCRQGEKFDYSNLNCAAKKFGRLQSAENLRKLISIRPRQVRGIFSANRPKPCSLSQNVEITGRGRSVRRCSLELRTMQLTKRKVLLLLAAVFAVVVGGFAAYDATRDNTGMLKLYGSIDMRTVELAFEESGRIEEVLVEEGMRVAAGQQLATLQKRRYEIARETAAAQVNVAQKELQLLLAGSRQEEIDAARAELEAAQASHRFAQRTCARETKLGDATTKLRVDEACSQAKVSLAQARAAQEKLDLLLAGTRIEQIEVARANLKLAEASLADAQRALENCTLVSPSEGVIRSRLREKGDMVSAQSAVYELALMTPLWARVWVDEVNLGRIAPGQKVRVRVDSYPDRVFEAVVGFVSTVAEFTPKTVQTEDLRTSLVYEVRATLADPQGLLRLGMPVTVEVDALPAEGA